MLKRTLLLAAVFLAAPVFAATYVWNGSASGQMSNGANWTGGSPAGDSAAELVFPDGAVRLEVVNDLPNLTLHSLSFSTTGYVIRGNAITVVNGQLSDTTLGPNTIAADLALSGDLIVVAQGGDIYSSRGVALSGQVRGTGSLIKLGPGRLILAGSSANTYIGKTYVRHGDLMLAKSPGVNAIPGDLVLDWTGSFYEFGHLTCTSNEQIPDTATIAARSANELFFGAVETVGPLVLYSGSNVSTATSAGKLILGGDVTVLRNPVIAGDPRIYANVVLPATRVLTVGPHISVFFEPFHGAPGAGLTIRGADETSRISIYGDYPGPTTVEGGRVVVSNPNTTVTLKNGSVEAVAKTLNAEHGTLSDIHLSGEVVIDTPVTLSLSTESYLPRNANGVTIRDAKLAINYSSTRKIGTTRVLLSNTSSSPIRGTFAGLPEGAILDNRFRISYKGGDGNDLAFTEAGKYTSSISLFSNGAAFNQPVTISARISTEAFIAPTGTVTFREGSNVLATVAAGSDVTATFTLPPGYHTITASYSGSEMIEPSEAEQRVGVQQPKPVIASVSPETILAGSETTLTIRGTNFVPGSRASIAFGAITTQYISPTELRAVWQVPSAEQDTTHRLEIAQPEPGAVYSDGFTLRITGAPRPLTQLVFDRFGINGRVTTGASGAWFSVAARGFRVETAAKIVADSDRDGTVRLDYEDPISTFGVYTLTDMTNGTILAGSPDGTRPTQSAFPPKSILRDSAGNLSHIIIPHPLFNLRWQRFMLVRPGTGAWSGTIFEGGPSDLDGEENFIVVLNTASLRPVDQSPAPPAGLRPGDVFLGFTDGPAWFADRVDDHLAEAAGPGVVRFAYPYATRTIRESAGVVRVTLMRMEGSDGAVSVNYATVNGTAVAGTHFQGIAGTMTFGAGEILKSIDIPITNDALYSGKPSFTVVLSDPAGATISGFTSQTISIEDDEPTPAMTVSSATVQEDDTPGRSVTLDVTLAGATRVPAKMNWYWSEHNSSQSVLGGELVFAPGETRKSITFPFDGDVIPNLDRSFGVWVYQFENAVEAQRGVVTVLDDDSFIITALDGSVRENGGTIQIPVATNIRGTKPANVTWRTVDGTAIAGSDYTASSGKLAAGTSSSITIPILNDTASEGNEWFKIELSEVTNGALRRSTVLVMIVDDDVVIKPILTVSDIRVAEGNNGTSTASFELKLASASSTPVVVRYSTSDETAQATSDYTAGSAEVTIAPGERFKTITVPIKGDTAYEQDETFELRISTSSDVTLERASARCTIANDDAPPATGPVTRHRSSRH